MIKYYWKYLKNLKLAYKFVCLFLILISFNFLQAQTIEIKGTVKNSLNEPLAFANVFAVPQSNAVKITFATSDIDGFYQLKIQKNKIYDVTTSYMGYHPKKTVFKFNKDTIYNFILKENPNQLDEIVLKYTMPIVVKKDTTTYNADSFVTGNERKLRDVLKKLPGIEVDRKGNVLANGKKVTQLLVEDKPFFGGNTKLGVNNIPADAIDKVQILEDYNAVAMLKGLQDDDKVALNIKLKKNKKKFIFGDIELGTGIKDKYLVHPKLFYYSPKTSINFITDINNTGKKSFTIKDYLDFEGGLNIMLKDPKAYFKLYRSTFAKYLVNQDFIDDKTAFGAFNIRQSVSNATDLSMYVITAQAKTKTKNKSENQYLFDTPFIENRTKNNQIDNLYAIGKLLLDYDPSKKTDYAFSSTVKISKSNSLGTLSTNSPDNDYTIETVSDLDAITFSQNISLNNDVSKKHTVTLNATYNFEKDKPNLQWNTNQELLENLIPLTTEAYYQIRQNKRVKTQYVNALLKDYWTFHRFHHIYTSIGVNGYNTSFYTNDYQLLANNTIHNFNNSNFGNDLKYQFLDTYLGLEYKFKVGKTTIKPAVFFHNYNWSTQQMLEAKSSFTKNLILPQFTAKVDFKNSEKLNLKYRLNTSFPNAQMLTNKYILSNFNRVYRGNSNLENNLYHSLSTSFYKFNLYKGYHFTFGANYNRKIKSLKTTTVLDGINQFSTQIQFNEPEINWSINGMFSKTIHNIKAKLRSSFTTSDYYQIINSTQSKNKSRSTTVTPSIKTLFKKYPNIEIGYKNRKSTYINTNTTKYTNEQLFTYLDYDYMDFIFEADFNYNSYINKTNNSINNQFINANASVFYQKEDSPWGFEINATNLFNAQFKQSNSISDFIITDSKIYILPRITMLKVTYKL